MIHSRYLLGQGANTRLYLYRTKNSPNDFGSWHLMYRNAHLLAPYVDGARLESLRLLVLGGGIRKRLESSAARAPMSLALASPSQRLWYSSQHHPYLKHLSIYGMGAGLTEQNCWTLTVLPPGPLHKL